MYIETKICPKCKEYLDFKCFTKCKSRKDGMSCWCIDCNGLDYQKRKDHIREQKKQYNLKNKEKIAKRQKEYRDKPENKSKQKERNKKYYLETRDKQLENNKKYYQENREKIIEQNKQYVQDNLEVVKERRKRYYIENRDKIIQQKKEYARKRRKDPIFRLDASFSAQLRNALGQNKGGRKWEDLVGYTLDDLKNHLESLFEPWMNFENHGRYELNGPKKWNIDHIIPKAWFNYASYDDPEFKECWALSNLQPKEALDNIIKSNNFIG